MHRLLEAARDKARTNAGDVLAAVAVAAHLLGFLGAVHVAPAKLSCQGPSALGPAQRASPCSRRPGPGSPSGSARTGDASARSPPLPRPGSCRSPCGD